MNTRNFPGPIQNAISPLTSSQIKRAVADQQVAAIEQDFPKGIAKPALRALIGAGYTNLGQLINAKESELLALHGMGSKAMGIRSLHSPRWPFFLWGARTLSCYRYC